MYSYDDDDDDEDDEDDDDEKKRLNCTQKQNKNSVTVLCHGCQCYIIHLTPCSTSDAVHNLPLIFPFDVLSFLRLPDILRHPSDENPCMISTKFLPRQI